MLVFYTGNTFHQPGDVLSLSGDRVGAETRRVTLARVVNRRTSAAACHAQPAYNANAVAPAFFPVSLSAQTEPAIDAEILQATEDSIKLRMPARAGIYQASLYGAAGELLQSVWLNLPQLETVLGDNGDSVSPGGLAAARGGAAPQRRADRRPVVRSSGRAIRPFRSSAGGYSGGRI